MTKIILSVVVVVGIIVAVVVFKNKPAVAPENGLTSESPVFCTQDARLCPDGSYVSRQGPNCQFAPCPTAKPSVSKSVSPTTSVKTSPSATPTASAAPKPQTVIVTFANGTGTPNTVNVKVGDTVKFVNNDNVSRWPASGVHPTHQICPGFDSLRGLNTGESYSFIFSEAKTCPWHDHLKPIINGQIVVGP
jgi:plastocyanin